LFFLALLTAWVRLQTSLRAGRLTQLYSVVGGNTRDQFTYGLDKGDNRLYKKNMLAGAKDELYAIDTLNRLTSFDRGDLNANKDGLTGAAVKYQDWTLDKVGNWPYFYDNSATAQTRLFNAANEITGRRRPYVNRTELGET